MIKNKLYWAMAILTVSALTGCTTSRVYVAASAAEDIRDVERPSGSLALISSPSGGSLIVGLAYEPATDHLFARVSPGTQIQEIERSSGNVLRTFPARRVTPGCGRVGLPIEVPNPTFSCGLAMRWSDRHLFLDHPSGNPITEIDADGNWVRNFTLRRPGGGIGGLAYDQVNNRLYVLFVSTMQLSEVDMDGNEIRRFGPLSPIQSQGLSIDSEQRELYIPLVDGNFVGVFDMNGGLIDRHSLNRAGGPAAGIGAGPRFGL